MKNLVFLIPVLLLLLSPTASLSQTVKSPTPYREIQVDPMDFTERNLSEISTSIHYVKLASPANVYFEYSPKVICAAEKIFIFGSDPNGDFICAFDLSGKFLFKIQRRGKGPGDYNQISDFLIDPVKNSITVLDSDSRKIIRYDLKGSYQDEIKIEVRLNQFVMVNNSTYFGYAELPFSISDLSSSDNFYFINQYGDKINDPMIPKNPCLDNIHHGFVISNGISTWFGSGYRDTLFQLDNSGKITGGYYLNFGAKQVYFLKKLKSLINRNERSELTNSFVGYSSIGSVLPLNDKVYIYYYIRVSSNDIKHHNIFLDLNSHTIVQSTGKLINDFDGIPLNGVPSGYTNNNELVYFVHMDELVETSKENKTQEFEKIYQKIKPATDSDNPVLAFVKLK
ncbi:MAG: 6-bladed beta-propeller [Bacteroidales bacterium]|nr:6-bladed beta-propeller [Bacteroidales bacterium]